MSASGPPGWEVFDGLRNLALAAVASESVSASDRHASLGGVVVDVPASGGYATVVALADETTSMYTSVGGGTIGAGANAAVAAATHKLIDTAESQIALFSPAADDELPPCGAVRFHALGFGGRYVIDVAEDCFWGKSHHELMPTIAATQHLISAIRATNST